MPVKHQRVAGAFRAEARPLLIKLANFVAEQASDGLLVAATQQVVAGESSMAFEINILIAEPGADLVPNVFGPQRKSRQPGPIESEANHRVVPRVAVLAAPRDIAVIENGDFQIVSPSSH